MHWLGRMLHLPVPVCDGLGDEESATRLAGGTRCTNVGILVWNLFRLGPRTREGDGRLRSPIQKAGSAALGTTCGFTNGSCSSAASCHSTGRARASCHGVAEVVLRRVGHSPHPRRLSGLANRIQTRSVRSDTVCKRLQSTQTGGKLYHLELAPNSNATNFRYEKRRYFGGTWGPLRNCRHDVLMQFLGKWRLFAETRADTAAYSWPQAIIGEQMSHRAVIIFVI